MLIVLIFYHLLQIFINLIKLTVWCTLIQMGSHVYMYIPDWN